ncbi:unnamed protein product [Nezara viridula]|uniref:Uncharacterized protein n=1 Tax=Nezara viridula TaxID=85310 RepID=A0A9P0H9C4_NEZVI|nr:unnamed protein product [Nezara viridula]
MQGSAVELGVGAREKVVRDRVSSSSGYPKDQVLDSAISQREGQGIGIGDCCPKSEAKYAHFPPRQERNAIVVKDGVRPRSHSQISFFISCTSPSHPYQMGSSTAPGPSPSSSFQLWPSSSS